MKACRLLPDTAVCQILIHTIPAKVQFQAGGPEWSTEPTGLFDTSSNSHSGRGSIEPGVERGPVVVYNGDDVALRIAQPRQLLKQHDRHTVADQ
jgi:hypothetical protein